MKGAAVAPKASLIGHLATVWVAVLLVGRLAELVWCYLPLLPLFILASLLDLALARPGLETVLALLLGPLRRKEGSFSDAWWRLLLRRMQQSGPVFVKLGQWAATRPDVIPESWCKELGRLHDGTEPHSLEHTHRVLAAAFPRAPWHRHFLIEPEPIGSGCIAQVYAGLLVPVPATLGTAPEKRGLLPGFCASRRRRPLPPSGSGALGVETARTEKVAVKVVHPQVRRAVDLDLKVLLALAWLADALGFQGLGASVALRQFADFLFAQADLTIEATNLKEFQRCFPSGAVVVPRVFEVWAHRDVLVMSFEEGEPLAALLEAEGPEEEDTKLQAWTAIVDAFWEMIFRHHLVHGDLHPGNVRWRKTAGGGGVQLVFLDCGLTIDLRGQAGDDLAAMVKVLLTGTEAQVGRSLIDLGVRAGGRREDVRDPDGFAEGIAELIVEAKRSAFRLSRLNAASLLGRSLLLGRRHRVRFDARFVNLVVAMAVLQGVALRLNADGDFLGRMRRYVLGAAMPVL